MPQIDLVKSLRALQHHIREVGTADSLDAQTCGRAADEIERLRAENATLLSLAEDNLTAAYLAGASSP